VVGKERSDASDHRLDAPVAGRRHVRVREVVAQLEPRLNLRALGRLASPI
jgi:hypothetical protein